MCSILSFTLDGERLTEDRCQRLFNLGGILAPAELTADARAGLEALWHEASLPGTAGISTRLPTASSFSTDTKTQPCERNRQRSRTSLNS